MVELTFSFAYITSQVLLICRANWNEAHAPVRRSKRLAEVPPKAGTRSCFARQKRKGASAELAADLEESPEGAWGVKSSSEDWRSEEEKTDTDTDNDDEHGGEFDEVSPVGVGKPHRSKQNLQVGVLTSYWSFGNF